MTYLNMYKNRGLNLIMKLKNARRKINLEVDAQRLADYIGSVILIAHQTFNH